MPIIFHVKSKPVIIVMVLTVHDGEEAHLHLEEEVVADINIISHVTLYFLLRVREVISIEN